MEALEQLDYGYKICGMPLSVFIARPPPPESGTR